MGSILGDAQVGDIRLGYCGGRVSPMPVRERQVARWKGARIQAPFGSILLKQLSMILRFSSSYFSARPLLAAGGGALGPRPSSLGRPLEPEPLGLWDRLPFMTGGERRRERRRMRVEDECADLKERRERLVHCLLGRSWC